MTRWRYYAWRKPLTGATLLTMTHFAVEAVVDSNNFLWRSCVMAIRKLIKEITPSAIVQRYRKSKIKAERSRFSVMSTADVFDEIYRKKLWGGDSELCSGSGSRGAAARQYVGAVTTFINDHPVDSILDIGCGDFYIGKAITERLGQRVSYIGVDVSPYVISYNRGTTLSLTFLLCALTQPKMNYLAPIFAWSDRYFSIYPTNKFRQYLRSLFASNGC